MARPPGRESVRLTSRGAGVAGAGAAFLAGGLLLQYPSFLAVGVCCAGVLLAATVVVARPLQLDARLRSVPDRAGRGSTVRIVAEVRNRGRRRSPRCELLLGDQPTAAAVPRLAVATARPLTYELRLVRRGELRVGPLELVRSDALRLLRRRAVAGGEAVLLVHPMVSALPDLPIGLARREGARPGSLFEGSVQFDGLRAYVPGDDPRRVHWPSYQRTGTLLIRTFVDTAGPSCTVVLDGDARSYRTDAEVEAAADVAASAVAAAPGPFRLRAGAGPPATDLGHALDMLARWAPAVDAPAGSAPDDAHGALLIVTGSLGPAEDPDGGRPARAVVLRADVAAGDDVDSASVSLGGLAVAAGPPELA